MIVVEFQEKYFINAYQKKSIEFFKKILRIKKSSV